MYNTGTTLEFLLTAPTHVALGKIINII